MRHNLECVKFMVWSWNKANKVNFSRQPFMIRSQNQLDLQTSLGEVDKPADTKRIPHSC